jgi:hypothetical protein
MRVIRKRCLGLDLHKQQNTAYLRVHQGSDQERSGFGSSSGPCRRISSGSVTGWSSIRSPM